jgi:hypothetical protein
LHAHFETCDEKAKDTVLRVADVAKRNRAAKCQCFDEMVLTGCEKIAKM